MDLPVAFPLPTQFYSILLIFTHPAIIACTGSKIGIILTMASNHDQDFKRLHPNHPTLLVPRPGIEPGPSVPKTDVISVSPSGRSEVEQNESNLAFLFAPNEP